MNSSIALMQRCATGLAALALLTYAQPSHAFVNTAVGGRAHELDLNLRLSIEAGKIEPNESKASWRKAEGFNLYTAGAGYNFGDLGRFQDFSLRLEGTFFTSPAERSDLTFDRVAVPPDRCHATARLRPDGACEFYSADRGTVVTATVSTNFVHTADMAFGVFVQGNIPIGMNLDKFANPAIHHVAVGSAGTLALTPWLSYQSVIYLGSGTRPFNDKQNGAIALYNLLAFEAQRWLLPWTAGVKVGPYMEFDIHERFDPRYDTAYSGVDATTGAVRPDRIRAARFAIALLPYFQVTKRLGIEAGYIQKLFGYDARATRFLFVSLRAVFEPARP